MNITPLTVLEQIQKSGEEYFNSLLGRSTVATQFTKGKTNALIKKWTLPLTTAGELTISLQGNFVYGFDGTDSEANAQVQFSEKNSDTDSFDVRQGIGYTHPFDKLHFTWTAQVGKTLTIYIANLAPDIFGIIDNRSTVLSTAVLQNILAELTGTSLAQGFNVITLNADPKLVVASNADRKSVLIQSAIANATVCYVGFDNSVTGSKYVIALLPGESYSVDDYLGDIYVSSATATDKVSYGEV
jgi:hypothetical protein